MSTLISVWCYRCDINYVYSKQIPKRAGANKLNVRWSILHMTSWLYELRTLFYLLLRWICQWSVGRWTWRLDSWCIIQTRCHVTRKHTITPSSQEASSVSCLIEKWKGFVRPGSSMNTRKMKSKVQLKLLRFVIKLPNHKYNSHACHLSLIQMWRCCSDPKCRLV